MQVTVMHVRTRRLGTVRLFKHEPDAGAVEERQIAESKQLAKAENLVVERLRTVDVRDGERNLTNLRQVEVHRPPRFRMISGRRAYHL